MSTDAGEFDPRRVQQALVCMHFDPDYAAAVYATGKRAPELPELRPRERELLRSVDPRSLATDAMRRTRALHVILDEYPVSAAVVGLDVVDRFFASSAFRECVFGRGSMALAFGQGYLDNRAKGVGVIETAMALARRGGASIDPPSALVRAPGASDDDALVRAPGVEALHVPAGSLAYYQRGRQRLGAEPIRALAKLRKPWSDAPPRRGREHLLIEAKPDGSLALGTASAALVDLLRAASRPIARAALAEVAVELGAEAEEAGELLDDLLGEGLLRRSAQRPSNPANDLARS